MVKTKPGEERSRYDVFGQHVEESLNERYTAFLLSKEGMGFLKKHEPLKPKAVKDKLQKSE